PCCPLENPIFPCHVIDSRLIIVPMGGQSHLTPSLLNRFCIASSSSFLIQSPKIIAVLLPKLQYCCFYKYKN
ncbi:MAG: hypothetical protein ACK53Y_00010, partial [bacterium]